MASSFSIDCLSNIFSNRIIMFIVNEENYVKIWTCSQFLIALQIYPNKLFHKYFTL